MNLKESCFENVLQSVFKFSRARNSQWDLRGLQRVTPEYWRHNLVTSPFYSFHSITVGSNLKGRFRNHTKSFTHKKYSYETELLQYVWHLKENNTEFTTKWSILKNSISYAGGSKICDSCSEEKLSSLKENSKYRPASKKIDSRQTT